MKRVFFLIIICIILLFCTDKKEQTILRNRHLTVSILPQKYFVDQITQKKWEVNVMVPPGHNPATYEPTPLQMKSLGDSLIYFRIGHIEFEKAWVDNFASLNPQMKIVDTSLGIQLIKSTPHSHHNHQHSDTETLGEHSVKSEKILSTDGIDPHIWLSPAAAKIICKNMLTALIEAEPNNQSVLESNYLEFIAKIDKLNKEISTILKDMKGKKFMVYHPAWSYFARDYGLTQLPIEIEGKEPRAADLRKFIDMAKRDNIKVIFVQQQFDTHSAEAIAKEIGGKVIQIDPLALNWIENVKRIAHTFKETLR